MKSRGKSDEGNARVSGRVIGLARVAEAAREAVKRGASEMADGNCAESPRQPPQLRTAHAHLAVDLYDCLQAPRLLSGSLWRATARPDAVASEFLLVGT